MPLRVSKQTVYTTSNGQDYTSKGRAIFAEKRNELRKLKSIAGYGLLADRDAEWLIQNGNVIADILLREELSNDDD